MRQTDEGIAYEESGLVMTNGYGSDDDEDDDDDRMNGNDADGDILEQGGYPWSLAVYPFSDLDSLNATNLTPHLECSRC